MILFFVGLQLATAAPDMDGDDVPDVDDNRIDVANEFQTV